MWDLVRLKVRWIKQDGRGLGRALQPVTKGRMKRLSFTFEAPSLGPSLIYISKREVRFVQDITWNACECTRYCRGALFLTNLTKNCSNLNCVAKIRAYFTFPLISVVVQTLRTIYFMHLAVINYCFFLLVAAYQTCTCLVAKSTS